MVFCQDGLNIASFPKLNKSWNSFKEANRSNQIVKVNGFANDRAQNCEIANNIVNVIAKGNSQFQIQ